MSVVDISQGFSHISPQELINYANNGVLLAGMVDLSEFVEYLIEQEDLRQECKYTEEDLDNAHEEGYRDGVRQCINRLEDL